LEVGIDVVMSPASSLYDEESFGLYYDHSKDL
jgi:hypothetical protein